MNVLVYDLVLKQMCSLNAAVISASQESLVLSLTGPKEK